MLTEKQGRKTFDDVAGIDEAKEELEEIVEFLRNPQKFSRLGGTDSERCACWWALRVLVKLFWRARLPVRPVCRSLLSLVRILSKCLSALAHARVTRHVRAGQERMRPALCLSTRLTRSAASRGAGYGGGNDEREQTLNQLLVEMDGFEANEGV